MSTESERCERKIRTANEMTSRQFQCTSPEHELTVYPKWLCFVSENQYKVPQFVLFTVENREPYPVSYHVKAREKLFRVDRPSGFLKSGERRVLRLYLVSSDDWPLALVEYSQKKLKVAVESIRIPTWLEPMNTREASLMARQIWKRSANEWPLERLYTKVNIHLASSLLSNKNPPPTTNVHTKIRV